MCGIVGAVGQIFKKEEEAFKNLLMLDTVRGPHSTGVVSVNSRDWESLKIVGTPWDLFDAKGFDQLWRRQHKALIGHNRWATVGKVTNDNAHPFYHKGFVGVHNGTLRTTSGLLTPEKFETDSEAIYNNFSKEGVEETIKKLNGAFALAWYNEDKCAVQLIRNNDRPLYICKHAERETYFFASEPWMIRVALGRADVKHSEPISLDVGMLTTFSLINKWQDPLLPVIKKLELYQPKVVYTYPAKTVAAGGGQIVPFVQTKKNGGGKVSLKDYLGKIVKFSVMNAVAAGGQQYIECVSEDDWDTEIRVYTPKASKLGASLLSSTGYFCAKVKKITDDEKYGRYLLVDNRTITDTILDGDQNTVGDNNREEYEVYQGRKVSLQEWYRNTEKGCAWCSDFPRPEEAAQLFWFGSGQFVCENCKHNPEVNQYMN